MYFLGGEGRWQLTWYQVEDDKWGVDVGLTPARLLAAVAVVGERIFLIGGVTVEEFGQGGGEVGGARESWSATDDQSRAQLSN